ncbi:hypothetical protein M1B34_31820 [Pseudomonas sp. MAFF 302030]|uniref:Uncharacterized protein n=1 Tax=Pseudomonas morbosilactucae TaxID=2938197 RepID=A0A9X1Z1X9_9PSED|nr:hypothetical protein [Pseudomonas morbosilactucae]MCK9802126.1 hypothetical protein [Pseudomonas morbosilactucae]
MTIIAGSFKGIAEALRNQGFLFLVDVKWIEQPCKCAGRWTCRVAM